MSDNKDLIERLQNVMKRIGRMCSDLEPPKMSIPARPDYDDDLVIVQTCKDAIAALEADKQGEHIAWLKYHQCDGYRTSIETCDSNDSGAFKVYRHPQPDRKAIEDRFALVPIEPTDEMIEEGERVYYSPPEDCSDNETGVTFLIDAVYKAMIAKAIRALKGQ